MKRYDLIEHTADVGIKAYGKTLKELFVNAAYGLFDIIGDTSAVKPVKTIGIELEAKNIEELLVAWLSELLFYFDSQKQFFGVFDIIDINENYVRGFAKSEPLDLEKHKFKTEVKAVTFHQLKVKEGEDGWTAEVIFDL